MKLAKRLMQKVTAGGGGYGDPYFANVVHLLQISPAAIDGGTDYENLVGNALVKCGTPVVTTAGDKKAVVFTASKGLEFDAGNAHVSPIADTARNGVSDCTFEFVFEVESISGSKFLWGLGVPGSGWDGCGQTLNNLGGFLIYCVDGKVSVNVGNLYRDGNTGYMGITTGGSIVVGRNEVVVKFVSNLPYIYINGVLQTITPTWQTKVDAADTQAYCPRRVNVGSYAAYNCARDTTLVCSGPYYSTAFNLIALRVTKDVVRPIVYPMSLPFPTTQGPAQDPYWAYVSLCIIPYDVPSVGGIWSTGPISNLVLRAGSVPIVEQSGVKCLDFNGNATNHIQLYETSAWMHDGVTPWTFDAIVYETTSNNYEVLLINTTNEGAGTFAFILIQSISGKIAVTLSGGGGVYNTNYIGAMSANAIPLNQFVKIRIIFTGTELKIYINSVLDGQATKGAYSNLSAPNLGLTYIGRYATTSYPLSMKLRAMRITKGVAREGTEDFIIESNAAQDINRTYLDLCLVPFGPNGTKLYTDISPSARVMTRTATSVVTATVDNVPCIYFPGSQGIYANSAMTYMHDGVTPWTMDAVVRIASNPGGVYEIAGNFSNNTMNNVWGYFQCNIGSDGKIFAMCAGTSGSFYTISSTAVTLNVFNKIRVTFDGSVLKIALNGVVVGSITKGAFTPSTYQATNMYIGRYPGTSSFAMIGHMAGFRVYKNLVLESTEDINVPFEIA